jgi:NTP pyrophosphatase (non-canonical NTP hydrolase)
VTPNEYQRFTRETATYPGVGTAAPEAIVYCALGLTGEAGEVAEKIKKVIRAGGSFTALNDLSAIEADLVKEVGDVLWYCSRLLDELGIDLEQAMQMNKEKLLSRKERGVIQGSGDNR